jgi:BspA type Leucine rich repeat region (6 copies)
LNTIGSYAFNNCGSLTTITIPSSVNFIGDQAFSWSSLNRIYLLGNAPVIGSDLFLGDIYLANNNAFVYYLPGTTGWGATFGYLPLVLWNPQVQTGDGSFGAQTNQFGFNITGNYNLVVVVEAASDLANPVWFPVSTNTLDTSVGTNGLSYFSDSKWMNHSGRYYRLRLP